MNSRSVAVVCIAGLQNLKQFFFFGNESAYSMCFHGGTLWCYYPGSLLHRDLSDKRDADARIKKASQAFGALNVRISISAGVPERLYEGAIY